MTLKEFEELLKENPILQQKFKAAKDAVSEEDMKGKGIALYGIIKNLGYDVPADEITLDLITERNLDVNELEAVAGGDGGVHIENGLPEIERLEKIRNKKAIIKATIRYTNNCKGDFTDTDCWVNDFCDRHIYHYGFDDV